MKYTHCGIEFEGNFCPICGKSMDAPKVQVHYANAADSQPIPEDDEWPQEQPEYQNAHTKDGKTESGLSLTFGIIGIVGLFIDDLRIFSLVFLILGLIFSIIGRNKAISAKGGPHGTGTAGMVLSIIGLAIWLLIFLSALALLAACASIGRGILDSL